MTTCAAPNCGLPLVQRDHEQDRSFKRRRTCGPRCRGFLSIASGGGFKSGPRPMHVPWPLVTGDIDWQGGFARHDRDPGDGGPFRMTRPDTRSYVGSSAAWLVREGAA